jgi:hypothetical protein
MNLYISNSEAYRIILQLESYHLRKDVIQKNYLKTEQIYLQEEKILKQENPCDINELDNLQFRLQYLQLDKLQNLLSKEFYNPQVLSAVTCVSNELYYQSPKGNTFTVQERMRRHLHHMKLVGDPSVHSKAFVVNYDNSQLQLVLKEARSDISNGNLYHEAFVGLHCLNQLLPYCPNFMYTYGIFESTTFITTGKQVFNFLPYGSQYNHLLVEYINPAVTFSTFLQTCTESQFKNMFMQVLYALEIAQAHCDFTHYDLHSDNVLIAEKFDCNQDIMYKRPDGEVRYIASKYVATIIDYGDCHVKYMGKDYGIYHRQYHNINNTCHQLYDVYKLLYFLAYHAFNDVNYNIHRFDIRNTVLAAMSLFNDVDDPLEILQVQRDFLFPYIINAKCTLTKYIDLLELQWNVDYSKNKFAILSNFTSKEEIDRNILKLNTTVQPTDIFVFYDMYKSAIRNSNYLEGEGIIANYLNSVELVKSFHSVYDHCKLKLNNCIHKLDNYTIILFSSAMIFSKEVQAPIILYLYVLRNMLDIHFDNKVMHMYAIKQERLYRDDSYLEKVTIIDQLINYVKESLTDKTSTFLIDLCNYVDNNVEKIPVAFHKEYLKIRPNIIYK